MWITCRTETDLVVEEIARKEQLITSSKLEQVRKLVQRILDVSCQFFLKAKSVWQNVLSPQFCRCC